MRQTATLMKTVQVRSQSPFFCHVAQLVEQLTVNQRVTGSSPVMAAILWNGGRVWLNALVLKTSVGKLTAGSNPAASASGLPVVPFVF